MVEANVKRFMVSVLRDAPEDTTWMTVQKQGSIAALMPPETLERMRRQYPDIPTQIAWAKSLQMNREAVLSAEDAAVNGHIEDVIASMPRYVVTNNQTGFADLVSTYESQFPLRQTDYARDNLFRYIGSIRAQRIAPGEVAETVQDVDNVAQRAARVGDVEALRNYGRVGGVIIGAPPSTKATVPIADISWSWTDGRVHLTLTPLGGSPIDIGAFDPETVNRALAYVVDGRAAAVTVLNADVIDRQQVMMHPALRDSLLGAQIGHADEWVFRVLDPENRAVPTSLHQSMVALEASTRLYRKALAIEKSGNVNLDEGSFDKLRQFAGQSSFDLLNSKKGFDSSLLRIVAQCTNSSRSDNQFSACVVAQSTDQKWKAQVASLTAPRTGIVSQIYEQPYALDSSLGFLVRSSQNDAIWPLQFTVQMTVNDQDRVTLPQFEGENKAQSTEMVLAGIRDTGEVPLLRRLQDFTIMQRLFRTALNGSFGPEFPVEKLVDLAIATKTPRTPCATPRWLNRPSLTAETTEQALAQFLREIPVPSTYANPEPPSVSRPIRGRIADCEAVLASPGAEFAPSGRLQSACKLIEEDSNVVRDCRVNPSEGTEACTFLVIDGEISALVGTHKIRERLHAAHAAPHIQPACVQAVN